MCQRAPCWPACLTHSIFAEANSNRENDTPITREPRHVVYAVGTFRGFRCSENFQTHFMSKQTRWKCYSCDGKGSKSKEVPNPISGLKRILFRHPKTLRVDEECNRCKGTGILMLAFEEVQKLEEADLEYWRKQFGSMWGDGLALKIKPLDDPIRPPQKVYDANPPLRCRSCGYTAPRSQFPSRKASPRDYRYEPDPDSEENYCPKCGKSDPS